MADLKDQAKERIDKALDKTRESADQAGSKVHGDIQPAGAQGRTGPAADRAEGFGRQVVQLAGRHPFPVLAAAVGIGFLLGHEFRSTQWPRPTPAGRSGRRGR